MKPLTKPIVAYWSSFKSFSNWWNRHGFNLNFFVIKTSPKGLLIKLIPKARSDE